MLPKFVICGVEHSGTTLLSDIFRQVKGLDAGFEVGVLLCNTPREFRTFKPFIDQIPEGWGVKEEKLDYICDTDSFNDFYEMLYEESTVISKPCEIFDKTPRYAWGIEKCLNNFDKKYIFTYKDPRALVWSNYKRYRMDLSLEQWGVEYLSTAKKYWMTIYENYKKIKEKKIGNDNILTVSLEEITLNTKQTIKNIFAFIDLPFSIDYLFLKNLRYPHTKADYISVKITFEYKLYLKKSQIQLIEKELSELKEWFYE